MAFGISRQELQDWKGKVQLGEIAILTHYWRSPRFPHYSTVTKVGCCQVGKLAAWGRRYGLRPEWIHNRAGYPHFDLLGDRQLEVLAAEEKEDQLDRFNIQREKEGINTWRTSSTR